MEKKGSDKIIVYLLRPFLSPNGDLYPILPDGYDLRHLPKAVVNFPYKKLVGSKQELDKFLAEQRKKESSKDRDLRVDLDISETGKLKEELTQVKEQNKALQESMTQVLNQMKELQSRVVAPSTPSKTGKKEETK